MPDERHLDNVYFGAARGATADCETEAVSLDDIEKNYRAAGLISPKGLTRLHLFRGKEPVISMQYVHMDSHSEFQPTRFKVVFAGTKSWAVIVTGRKLWEVYDSISRHCCPWVRQVDRDLGTKDGEPVITKIEVIEV